MRVVYLTPDNVLSYIGFIPADVADHIGRIFIQGIIVTADDKPCAGMIWEIQNVMNEKAAESRIIWIAVEDDDAAVLLFEEYRDCIVLDEVKRSFFSIPASVVSREKDILLANGFTVELSEGDEITASLMQIADMTVIRKASENKAIHPLKEASSEAFSDATKLMSQNGLTGLCEDLIYLPRSYFENDVSCFFQQGESINGLFLFHLLPSGNLKLMLMAYIGNDYSVLLEMMKRSLLSATETYSLDTGIVIDRHNLSALALGERLLPHDMGRPVYIGCRTEN